MDPAEFVAVGAALMEKGGQLNKLRGERDQLTTQITALEVEVSLLLQKHTAAIAAIVGVVMPQQQPSQSAPMVRMPGRVVEEEMMSGMARPAVNERQAKAKEILVRQVRALLKQAAGQGAKMSVPDMARQLNVDLGMVREAMITLKTGGAAGPGPRPPRAVPQGPAPLVPEEEPSAADIPPAVPFPDPNVNVDASESVPS